MMEYIYGAMLLHKAGKELTEDSLKSVLSSAGVKVDEGKVKATISALKDVNIDEVISKASVAQVVATAPVEETQVSKDPKAKEKPKESEKPEEEASTEEAAAGLGALFG